MLYAHVAYRADDPDRKIVAVGKTNAEVWGILDNSFSVPAILPNPSGVLLSTFPKKLPAATEGMFTVHAAVLEVDTLDDVGPNTDYFRLPPVIDADTVTVGFNDSEFSDFLEWVEVATGSMAEPDTLDEFQYTGPCRDD